MDKQQLSAEQVLLAIKSTKPETMPDRWLEDQDFNPNYLGGFLTGVRYVEWLLSQPKGEAEPVLRWVKASERLPEGKAGHYGCRKWNETNKGWDYKEMLIERPYDNDVNIQVDTVWYDEDTPDLVLIEWLEEVLPPTDIEPPAQEGQGWEDWQGLSFPEQNVCMSIARNLNRMPFDSGIMDQAHYIYRQFQPLKSLQEARIEELDSLLRERDQQLQETIRKADQLEACLEARFHSHQVLYWKKQINELQQENERLKENLAART